MTLLYIIRFGTALCYKISNNNINASSNKINNNEVVHISTNELINPSFLSNT